MSLGHEAVAGSWRAFGDGAFGAAASWSLGGAGGGDLMSWGASYKDVAKKGVTGGQ